MADERHIKTPNHQIAELGDLIPEGTPPPKAAFAEVVAAFHEVEAIPIEEADLPDGFELPEMPEGFTPTHVRIMAGATSPRGFEATCVSFLGDPAGLPEVTRFVITGIQIPNGPLLDLEVNRATRVAQAELDLSPHIADGLNEARRVFAPRAILNVRDVPTDLQDRMHITPGPNNMDAINYADSKRGLGFSYNPTVDIMDPSGERPIGRTFTETASGLATGESIVVLEGRTTTSVTPSVSPT